MRRCPNCDRMAERTEDWACQWCGYPLLSRSYKKIPKTYQQLKGEKPLESEPEPKLEPEPEVKLEPEPEPKPEPVSEVKPEPEPEPEPEPKPEPVSEVKPEPELEPEPKPEPVPEVKPEPVPEPKPEPKPEVKPEPTPKPKGGLTVEELYSDFSADSMAADAKFTDKTLTVAGVVDRITVNDMHGIYYIILASAEKKAQWNVRCMFERKDGARLNQLTAGQTVTVQGKYDGYRANILMKDCTLIS